MDFQEFVELARIMEKAVGEKKPVSCEVSLPKTVDFSPEEFLGKDYQDMLNDYERMIKVAKAGGIAFKPVSVRVETLVEKAPEKISEIERKAATTLPAPAARAPQSKAAKPAAQKPVAAEEKKPLLIPVLVQPQIKKEEWAAPPPKEKKEKEAAQKKAGQPEYEKEEFAFERIPAPSEEEKPVEKTEAEKRIGKLLAPQPAGEKEAVEERAGEAEGARAPWEKPPEPEAEKLPEAEGEGAEKPVEKTELEFDFEEAGTEEKERAEAEKFGELELEFEKSELEKKKETFSQETKEVMGEVSEIPYMHRHEPATLAVPPVLSLNSEEVAGQKFSELEAKMPKTVQKTKDSELRKRMIELTKELFKEKDRERIEEVKKELAELRETLSKKAEAPAKRAVSYATSFLDAVAIGQTIEIREAKEKISKEYLEQISKILPSFSSALKMARSDKEKREIYDIFASDLEGLRAQAEALCGKYENFLMREHTVLLEKVKALASARSDRYVADKAGKEMKELRFSYSNEFLSVADAVRKDAATLLKSKMHEALGMEKDSETEKVLAIANMHEDELIKYVHARHPEKYEGFETGKITKLELLALARALMAAGEGLKKDTVNKYFGG